MSNGMTLTKRGRELLALALTGKNLHFTRAQTGDGDLGSADPYNLTALISPKQTLEIQSMNASQTGICEVVVEMSNNGLSSGYFVREYGLFAKDPNSGKEILYSYANKGNNCSYMEADGGIDKINYSLSLITVIDQAENITATINNSNAYVTTTKLDARFSNLYAEGVTPLGFWTYAPAEDNRLRKLSLADLKRLILGSTDINALLSRIDTLENNLAEVLLSQEMQNLYPNYSHYIIEDFKNVNQVDTFSCKVTSVVAGDDSLDCNPIDGMIPGSWYTLSDGVNSESVQVKSISLENEIQRVILFAPVKNTYILEYCNLFRTNTLIQNEKVTALTANNSTSWENSFTWRGTSTQQNISIDLTPSVNNSVTFDFEGNAKISSDGYFTLGE